MVGLQGTLEDFKTREIFELLALHDQSGVLSFRAGKQGRLEIVVALREGYVTQAYPRTMPISQLLIKAQLISEKALEAAEKEKASSDTIGQVLVRKGLVAERDLKELARI